jgi:hypothetical protein
MLIEKDENKQGPFNVGQVVKVRSLDQVGTIVGATNGVWEVKLTEGNTITCTTSDIEQRQVLLG